MITADPETHGFCPFSHPLILMTAEQKYIFFEDINRHVIASVWTSKVKAPTRPPQGSVSLPTSLKGQRGAQTKPTSRSRLLQR